ncbi:hypothetical protein F442_06259 [Phytophthora nicotianae P10297]|uniref:Uncharacterized protein n=2 Tax=Phytophthora nicotianae TaxID=4792 RepID=W2RAZ1_PHYN3|nr:hypothetical protein PPTG_02345 [Phytophthora nicotianae INRA-310]ETN22396.1 hypothetical protein PPTG_02345 [Phytophthora nicotianae INRA-310]ETP47882.1 hypothetical protein F442_06259 [Phytophthora nicotianae P10297]
MPKLLEGNRVCGKRKRHLGKTGVILRVLKSSRQHTYEVEWSTGVVDIVSARSICIEQSSNDAEHTSSGEEVSFVELLRSETSGNQAGFSCESSSSDEDEEENDDAGLEGHSEAEEDDTVVAHGRLWDMGYGYPTNHIQQALRKVPNKVTVSFGDLLNLSVPTI